MAACFLIFFIQGYGVEPREYAVEVSVEVLSSPFALRLSWEPSAAARTYTIRRRTAASADWAVRASLPGDTSQFVDSDVSSGIPYEYEIQLETSYRGSGGWVNAYGYVLAGGNVAWPEQKGKVLLVVEAAEAASLNAEIAAFQRDLIGAGWQPIRRDVARTSSVPEVKNLIRSEYNADPANLRAVILVGHVPVPYSGNIAPDLHESHQGAWPADVYYAEMDGTWTDNTVSIKSGDYSANDNWPGDGKFDQSQIPSTVELEIGRIDFYDLPAFEPRTGVELVRNYLRKNSEFRHRMFTAPRRMLVRDNFGDLSGDAPAVDAWRHYRQFFGAGTIREVGPGDFFPVLDNESYLWAYGGGGGGNTKADGVGTTTDFATRNPRAVFLILHGSYFGDWNTKDNFLRAAIAAPDYTLASIWSGLPHWYMHPMGLGKSIGFCTRLTQNNLNTYKSHQNFSPQQVHISLIGDPTLECFPVIPPNNFEGTAAANINLNWSVSTDENIVGYHVYHSASSSGPFQRITPSPIASTAYSHAVGMGTHHYMLRAVKLERTGSGTFFNLSQGRFTSVTKSSTGTLPTVTLTTEDSHASESGDRERVRFVRSIAGENPLTVDLLIGGTAANGVDYSAIGSSAIIPAGSTFVDLTISPVVDNLIEDEETVTIEIQPDSQYLVGNPAASVIAIADGVNHPPTALPQAVETIENTPIAITLQGSDPEGQALSYKIKIPPSHGMLSGTAPNITYKPFSNYFGGDAFSFCVNDGQSDSAPAEVSIDIAYRNKPPVAVPAQVETLEDNAVNITLAGTDPENDLLEFEIVQQPAKGTISGEGRSLLYTPKANIIGTDSFTFRVRDDEFISQTATVAINIIATNDPPLATNMVAQLSEDGQAAVHLNGIDPDLDTLSFFIVSPPLNGVITGGPPDIIYKPARDFYGADMLTYRVSDGTTNSVLVKVTFNVEAVNDPPTISEISPQAARKNSTLGPLPIELNDADRAIGDLAISFESSNVALAPTNRMAITTTTTNRQLTVFPNNGVVGEATITIQVSDGEAVAQTSFHLLVTNTPPAPRDDNFSVAAGRVSLPSVQLLANDHDPDGDQLRMVSVSGSHLGRTVQLTNDVIIYLGSTNSAEDSFEYTVEDSSGARAAALTRLTLRAGPRIESVRVAGADVHLRFSGPPNTEFNVLWSADMESWTPLWNGMSDATGAGEYREIGATQQAQRRFYKVVWP